MSHLERTTHDELNLKDEVSGELRHPGTEVHWGWLLLLVVLVFAPVVPALATGQLLLAFLNVVLAAIATWVGYHALVKKVTITRF